MDGGALMSDLIKALQIFLKYGDPKHPTVCSHDELWICGVNPADVSAEDVQTLEELGFFVDGYGESFKSFRYGSA